jgi:hypothetical protein
MPPHRYYFNGGVYEDSNLLDHDCCQLNVFRVIFETNIRKAGRFGALSA